MNEQLLQFIWQFQYFSFRNLETIQGEPLQIIYAGKLNTNQGPDFIEAKIKIGTTTWVGNVELHLKTSDWERHKHSSDANYKNVILHIVWENDTRAALLPVLELQNHVSTILISRYQSLMEHRGFIPCENGILNITEITWSAWKDRLLAERLQRKTGQIALNAATTINNWEEIFWWALAKNFGTKQNELAFETLAKSLPVTILAKCKSQPHQIEALLFGQAGLLETMFKDEYPLLLTKEYLFLKAKYQLQPIQFPLMFLRMRPPAFPTVRLAQLAMLIHQSSHLFSKIIETESLANLVKLFSVPAGNYWDLHYIFDTLSEKRVKKPGKTFIENLIINTVIPIVFSYGKYNGNDALQEKALGWLQQIKAEQNHIIDGFGKINIQAQTAFDTQALIELKNEYCDKKRCLHCAVGNSLIREKSQI